MRHLLSASLLALGLAACGQAENKADTPFKNIEKMSSEIERTAGYSADKNVYFGDLHIHTKNSFDAYIFNVRSTPDDVYRFAKGETVRHPAGFDITIGGDPLDFVAATDHGAYMGILPAMNNPDSPLSKLPMAKEMFGTDPALIVKAFNKIGGSVRTYEFTSVDGRGREDDGFAGGNLHRNVVFKDGAPKRLFSTLDSTNPEDLWTWMDGERADGRDVMAIPHNSNVSDGKMFAMTKYDGGAMDAAYSKQRVLNEPIVEMTQVKGTSETHPALSPNDEWADFEIYEKLLASNVTSKINGSYIREALALLTKKTIGQKSVLLMPLVNCAAPSRLEAVSLGKA